MSSLDEILDLEAQIVAAKKGVAAIDADLIRIDAIVVKLEDGAKIARDRLAFHQQNRTHLQTKCDLVDLNEFARIGHVIGEHEISVESHESALLEGQVKKANAVAQRAELQITIERCQAALGQYGQLVKFPKK